MTREAITITRRKLILGTMGAGGLLISGCDRLSQMAGVQRTLEGAEKLSFSAQRLLLSSSLPLAREYGPADISERFKANGTVRPEGEDYARLVLTEFTDWTLAVDGLVAKPLKLSLNEIKAMPSRSQITRHDCVEGWSAIGQWRGVPLSHLLQMADLMASARYIVFHCADDLLGSSDGRGLYYESIDLTDAFHPQTILAYEMNGQPLPVSHGAPLRLRVERQLGYKMAKYVMRIEAVESYARFGMGKGGFWEDRGYEWYAGI